MRDCSTKSRWQSRGWWCSTSPRCAYRRLPGRTVALNFGSPLLQLGMMAQAIGRDGQPIMLRVIAATPGGATAEVYGDGDVAMLAPDGIASVIEADDYQPPMHGAIARSTCRNLFDPRRGRGYERAMSSFDPIRALLSEMSPVEGVAALLILANVWLVARRSIWNYAFGIIAVAIYGAVFFDAKLYSDTLLQVFFLVVQLYGWRQWRRSQATAARCRRAAERARTARLGRRYRGRGRGLGLADAPLHRRRATVVGCRDRDDQRRRAVADGAAQAGELVAVDRAQRARRSVVYAIEGLCGSRPRCTSVAGTGDLGAGATGGRARHGARRMKLRSICLHGPESTGKSTHGAAAGARISGRPAWSNMAAPMPRRTAPT